MTRLDKFVFAMIRCSIGAAAALVLLAACAGSGEAQAAQTQSGGQQEASGQPETVQQTLGTDYEALYEELSDA